MTVTLKNYGKGLSQILHQNASNTFTVKGPLGIPLNIQKRNVAFCAGTGVLPFLDLIKVMLEDSTVNLELHVSFKTE